MKNVKIRIYLFLGPGNGNGLGPGNGNRLSNGNG